jgi:arabinogalactan endo-1,4-beta-galactosidase
VFLRQFDSFDVIGQSYYPWWQGSLKELENNLEFMATRYKKPIIVVETAYDRRDVEEFKTVKPPYPQTPQGQGAFLSALVKTVKDTPNGLGTGVFWWEPMAEGAIAKRGMFDDQHEALPAVKVFGVAQEQ